MLFQLFPKVGVLHITAAVFVIWDPLETTMFCRMAGSECHDMQEKSVSMLCLLATFVSNVMPEHSGDKQNKTKQQKTADRIRQSWNGT